LQITIENDSHSHENMRYSRSQDLARPVAGGAGAGSPAWRLWGWPVLLGLLTASGLVSALVSEAGGDVWSWLALGVPVAVMAWFSGRRPSRRPAFFGAPRRLP
jgi:hypothetical protein